MSQKKIKNKLIKKSRGTALVYTILVLSASLSMALSVAGIAVIEKKSAFTTDKSNHAFQIADSGVEVILRAMRKNPPYNRITDISDDSTNYNGYSCSDGVMKNDVISGGKVEITFYDLTGNKMGCNDLFNNVKRIKSIGSFEGNTRAVDVTIRN